MPDKTTEASTLELDKVKKRISKRSAVLVAVTALAACAAGLGGYVAWKKYGSPEEAPKQAETLVEQYKDQLPELKEKAESGNIQDLQNYAVAQYATGDTVGAEETYRRQIAADDRNALAHNNLANSLRDQKKFDEAVEHYEKAIEISPNSLAAYINLGSVYQYSLGQKDKAIDVYNRAIEKNPSSADLHILLAIAYEQANDVTKAENAYNKALAIDGENKAAKAALERLNK